VHVSLTVDVVIYTLYLRCVVYMYVVFKILVLSCMFCINYQYMRSYPILGLQLKLVDFNTEQNRTEGLFPYKHIIYKYM